MNTNSHRPGAPPEATFTSRQAEILDRTRELVEESGLANLTMKKVAARVGFTEAAIYRHFPNKQALILGLIDRMRGLLIEPIATIAGDRTRPPRERLAAMVGHHVGLLRGTRGLPFLLLAEGIASGNRELLERMAGVLGTYLRLLAMVLGEAGAPTPPPLAHQALLFIGLPAMLGMQVRAFPDRALDDREAEELVVHYVRALTARVPAAEEVRS